MVSRVEPEKRDAIVAAAAKAFSRWGFRKTSVEEIARAAGVAKGTVYLGCTSKRDLFYRAVLLDLERWNAELARVIDPTRPADALLVDLAREAVASVDRYPLARGLLMGEVEQDLPDWAEHLDELRAHGLSTVLEVLRLGVLQGRLRADLDLEATAGVLLDLVATTIMYHSRGPDPGPRLARRAAALFDVVTRGIVVPAAVPSEEPVA